MKILHLDIEGGFGGSSRSLQILVSALKKKGVNCEVWHAKKGPSNYILSGLGVDTYINKNIVSIVPLEKNNLKNIFVLSIRLLKLINLSKQIINNSADILHLNYNGLLPLCFLLRKKGYKKKIIVHTRTIIPNNFFGRQFSKLYKYVDGNIIISKAEKSQFIKVNKSILENQPNEIINNCAPARLFKKKITIVKKKKFRVIFLGTIDYIRAPDRILNVAIHAKKMGLPLSFHIYGNEGYKPKIRKKNFINYNFIKNKIDELGLKNNVFFNGFSDNPEKELLKSDILIRPSRKGDCWGRDIIEAMAAGLFIIASGKEKIFIENKYNGILVENWNAEKIASTLNFYLNNIKQFNLIKKRARSFALENFLTEKHTDSFLNFIKAFD